MTETSESNRISRIFRFKHGISSTDQISQYSEESELQLQQSPIQQRSPPRRNGSLRLFRKSSNLSTNGDRSSKVISNMFTRSNSRVERESIYLQPNDSKTTGLGFQLNTPFIHQQQSTTLESFADTDCEMSDDEIDGDSVLVNINPVPYKSIFLESFEELSYNIYQTEAKLSCDHLIHTLSSIEEKAQSKPQLSIDTTLQNQKEQQNQEEIQEFPISAPSSSNIYSISPQTFESEDSYPEPNINLDESDGNPCQDRTMKVSEVSQESKSEIIQEDKNNRRVSIADSTKPSFESHKVRSFVSRYSDKTFISENYPISKPDTYSTPGTSHEDIQYLTKKSDIKNSNITLVAHEIESKEDLKTNNPKSPLKISRWFSKLLKTNRTKEHTAPIIA